MSIGVFSPLSTALFVAGTAKDTVVNLISHDRQTATGGPNYNFPLNFSGEGETIISFTGTMVGGNNSTPFDTFRVAGTQPRLLAGQQLSSGGSNSKFAWFFHLNSSISGSQSVTFSTTATYAGSSIVVAVWKVLHLKEVVPTASIILGDSLPRTFSLPVQKGGCIIGIASGGRNSNSTVSWSGLDQQFHYDGGNSGRSPFTLSSKVFPDAATPSMTVSATDQNQPIIGAIALR